MGPLAQSRVLLGVVAWGPGLTLLEAPRRWGQDQVWWGGLKVTNVYCAALGLWAGFPSEALTGIKSCNAVAGESFCNAQGLCCPGLG